MDWNTFQENSLFPVGEENTSFAPYFDGTSYLNLLSLDQVVIGNVTFQPAAGTTGTSTRPAKGADRSCWSPPAGVTTRPGANLLGSSIPAMW